VTSPSSNAGESKPLSVDLASTDCMAESLSEAYDDEALCPECEGDGGDKWNDYCLPCATCGGDGRLW
jgi:DnaJ-class molecular chaperone